MYVGVPLGVPTTPAGPHLARRARDDVANDHACKYVVDV